MSNNLRWASTLLRSLYQSGVRNAVISPGSRSTPLTIAAAIHPGIRKQVVLDERSAAFIALGIGKTTGIPAILICTSGTAAANYFPAIIEAKESGVPMIILSADRPPALRGIGSSQTIDQMKLFGDHAVFFHEAGEPQPGELDLKRVDYLGKQALNAAIHSGGAAHINLPFRKPLEPSEEELKEETYKCEYDHKNIVFPVDKGLTEIHLASNLTKELADARRPLIIAGPSNPHHSLTRQLQELSKKIMAPVLAEPGSGLNSSDFAISRYEQFLRSESVQEQLKPDLIIRFGDQPFTKSILTALERWSDLPVIHFSARRSWQDNSMSVTQFIECSIKTDIRWGSLAQSTNKKWLSEWKIADQQAETILRKSLDEIQNITDGHVFSTLSNQSLDDWNIMLSNSFIPRDMAMFGSTRSAQFVNRGAAGIDGITSTAVGIHQASRKPTLCITGDLAFLHDSNALLSLKAQDLPPFVILIVNNGGGTIFRMLPIYKTKEIYTEYFETPQNVRIESLAKAHNVTYRKIASLSELGTFDLKGMTGYNVIEIKTDPDESMKLRNTLWNS